MEKDKLIKMLIGFLPLLLLFLDPPEGMDPKAWGLFPFYAGAILMVMLRPVGEATALAIFLGLYAVIMRGHTVALSGFALTMTWLVVGAYIIAQAFRDTNLGKRISFWMIRIFGRSTLGLGYAAAFADFIIAPVTRPMRRAPAASSIPSSSASRNLWVRIQTKIPGALAPTFRFCFMW